MCVFLTFVTFFSVAIVLLRWRFIKIMKTRKNRKPTRTIPWLLVPEEEEGNGRKLMDISNSDVSRTLHDINLNDTKCYSSAGWLLVVGKNLNLFLWSPFLGMRQNLPSVYRFEDWETSHKTLLNMQLQFIKKFIFSGKSTRDLVLMVIYGKNSKVAFYRPGGLH